MATSPLKTTTETPAQTLLRVEQQNIAKTGSATPVPVTGSVQANSTLPSGYGSDLTGRIYRYTPDGKLNTGATPNAPTPPTPSAPTTPPTGTTPPSSSTSVKNDSATTPPVSYSPSTMSRDEYLKQYAVDENAIKEQARKDAQARIDAVNAIYDDMVRKQTVTNTANEGSTRAINARSGLIGSDFGAANDANQRAAGDAAIKGVNLERDAKITGILAEMNKDVEAKIQSERERKKMDADSYNAYLEKQQSKAKDYVTQLGQNGMSFDQLKEKDPNAIAHLLENTGLTETELALRMNAANKTANKIDWKVDVSGNHVIVSGVNPATGKLEYHTQEIPAEFAKTDIKEVNGELWSISPDGKTATKIGGPGPKQNLPSSAQEYEYAVAHGYKGTYNNYQNEDANRKATVNGNGSGSTPTSYKEWQLAGSPGTYASWLKSSGKDTSGRPLSAAQSQLLSDGAQMEAVLNPIKDLVENKKNLFGPISGLNALNPYDTESKVASAKLETAAQMVGKYMEGGVLRQEDVAKYKKMLPQITDTPEVAKAKLENVQGMLKDKQQQYIRDYAASGFDVSKFDAGSAPTTIEPAAPTNDEITQLRAAFPGMSDKDILDSLGKTNDLSTSQNGSPSVGSLSARFESNGNPGAIGKDNTGGWSYGTYQLAHNNAKSFVDQSPYAKDFAGIPFNSQEFRDKWKEVAQKDPAGFEQAQRGYIEKTHFEPQKQILAQSGINVDDLSPTLKDVIWSTVVQHGPNTPIIINAIKSMKKDASESDLIKKIYALRWGGGMNFSRSTDDVKKSVYQRFFGKNGELATALSELNSTG